jgi:hypothetical protein
MGGGGGGGSTQFQAQGAPPSFDYQSAAGLNQLATGGDIQAYALSDQDFANRYPALQAAYNTYQANLAQQTGQVGQGQANQSALMGGLANQIAGRMGTPTTTDIQNIQNAAATAAGATQPIYNLGSSMAGLAQPMVGMGQQQGGLAGGLVGMGQQQAGLAQPLFGMGGQQGRIGQAISGLGGQVAGMAATPYAMGQQLLQEPIDPQTQQQMMRAGLSSAAGSLGAASLGQGMAGQAAAARQLGLNTLQYGQAMRGEAMSDIGQAASIAGQGGQLQGLGAQTIGAGGQTIGLGGQQITQGGGLIGLGGQQLAQGAQTMGLGGQQLAGAGGLYNMGAQTAATAGGLSQAAQQAQEAYGMNTAQMAGIYGGLQNQQALNLQMGLGTTGQLFPKRTFGLGGTNAAQSELGQSGAYNSFQQANYATMNGIAFNQAQMAAQQQQLQQQQQAGMISAGVGAAGAVASAATVAAVCWVARECLGTKDSRWKQFRIWMLNFAPDSLRSLYLRRGREFADYLSTHLAAKAQVRAAMLRLLETEKRCASLLSLNVLLTA